MTRTLTVGALTLFFLQILVLNPIMAFKGNHVGDFSAFYYASKVMSQGGDPYDAGELTRLARSEGYTHGARSYFYPPFLAQILRPLTWLEVHTARKVWLGISSLAIWLSFWLLMNALFPPATARERAIQLLVLATFSPITDSLWVGQVNGVVLLALAVWLRFRQGSRWAAVSLGAAMAIKMSPTFLVLFLLMRRAWLEAFIALLAAVVFVGGSALLSSGGGLLFFREVFSGFLPGHQYHQLGVPIDLIGNHSLAALAYQVVGGGDSHVHLPTLGVVLQLGAAAALVSWWVWRNRWGIPWEASLAGAVILMVILPTYTYEHHLVYLLIPFALFGRLAFRGRIRSRYLVPCAIGYALLAMPVSAYSPLPDLLSSLPILSAIAHLPKLFPMLLMFFLVTDVTPEGQQSQVAQPRPA